MKLLEYFIETIFWLAAFLSPALAGFIVAAVVYINNESLKELCIAIIAIAAIMGIVFAEWVRRKYGCSNFFGRLSSSSDVKDRNGN